MGLLLVQLAENSGNGSAGEQLARGDVVRVLADRGDVGFRQSKAAWIASGRAAEAYPMGFVVVEVTDMTDEEAESLITTYPAADDPALPLDSDGNPVFEFMRRWGFVASGIAPARQAELMANGELITTKALVAGAVVDKAGLLSFEDL